VFHDKSKHIEIRYHYICDMMHRGALRLHHIADILTQASPKGKFLVFREQVGLMDVTLQSKGPSRSSKGPSRSRTLSYALPPV